MSSLLSIQAAPPSIGDLVDLCQEYMDGKRSFTGKPEEGTKQVLIEPLFEHHLFWSKMPNDDYYEREFRGQVKGREWKDIALLTEKKPRIFVETKACTDTNIDTKYAKELLTYLKDYNADKNESEWVTWGILTNFMDTYFYHWSEPVSNPTPFYVVSYKELSARLQELQTLISPEGVRNNRLLNRYLESPAHKLDEDFLQDLKKWRKIIANGFYKNNSHLSLDEISELSHVFLSRLIFLRRLEATGVLQPHWLKNQYEAWKAGRTLPTPTFSEYLRELVKNFWRLYDTELFEEQACDKCEFEDSYFKDLLKYMDAPISEVRLVTGTQELQDRGLYGYKFGELTLDILGAVYERYLAHRLEFKIVNDYKIVTIEETAELRQKEGAYFTPPHIVRFIVAKTLEPKVKKISEEARKLLAEHDFGRAKNKIREIASVKVVDPATGSGSFLIEAFKTLVRYYNIYNEAVSEEFSRLPYQHNQTLDFQIDKVTERVLLENLYGVDLDPKAVEMTKLDLWLHHIDSNQQDYHYSGGPAKKKLLPSLDLNIQVGNSIIDGDTSRLEHQGQRLDRISILRRKLAEVRIALSRNKDDMEIGRLQKEDRTLKTELDRLVDEVEKEVNTSLEEYRDSEDFKWCFNWQVRFPEVFAQGGFDVYIGNPPYINLYKFTDNFRRYLSKRDKEIFRAKNDILYHFYKRGVELLNEDGSLGYITSRYLLEAENADLLRGFLADNTSIRILIDYGNVELFRGVNTRCIAIIFDKSHKVNPKNTVRIGKVRTWKGSHSELTQLIDAHIEGEFYTRNGHVSTFGLLQKSLGKEPWRLLSPREISFRDNIEKNSRKLGGSNGLCDIGMGMQTGLDKAFRVTKKQIKKEGIPAEFVRKLVRNGDIRRYVVYDRNEYWIYTEDVDVDALDNSHPVKKHLTPFIEELRERYPCRTCGHCSKTFKTYGGMEAHWAEVGLSRDQRTPKRKWYQYTVPNIKELFSYEEKIIVPYKAPSNRFALDREKRISSMDVYVCSLKRSREKPSPVGLRYVLAILNSTLMDYAYITFYGRRKKSEFEYYTGLIGKIPIRKPSPEAHKTLEESAEDLLRKHATRVELMELFLKRLDSMTGKSKEMLKHYYDNAWAYTITDKERLFKDPKSQVANRQLELKYTVYKVGVEEVDNTLLIEAEFQVNSELTRRERVLKITVKDKDIRSFLLHSIKRFIENSRGKKIIGREADLLDAILKHVELSRLRTNIEENIGAIHYLMKEFKAQAPITSSISELERQICDKSREIDEVVYSLYELGQENKEMLREMYHCETVSEYFDRLEEYLGVEDIRLE